MTPEEFNLFGLEKLTAEERAALQQWLLDQRDSEHESVATDGDAPQRVEPSVGDSSPKYMQQASGEAAAPTTATDERNMKAREQAFGLEALQTASNELAAMQARVVNRFSGWKGGTVFKLDNGQVWKQRTAGKYYYTGDDTRVEIRKNVLGFYEMELLAAGRAVGVRRLK